MAILERIIPSMFHRRMLLLGALSLASLGVLALQASRLTLGRGDELRREAEARLVRRVWLPTYRGSILDRKGRVLAKDRPSYDLRVDYRVITGDWARTMAVQSARRSVGHRWLDLSPEERETIVGERWSQYQAHLDRAWNVLAERAGITREKLDLARDAVITDVSSKFDHIATIRRVKAEDDYKGRGEEITPKIAEQIEKASTRPIAEQSASHTLLARLRDDVAFEIQSLLDQEVEIDGADDRGTRSYSFDEPSLRQGDRAPLLPGVEIVDSGDREYPLEAVPVQIDLSTLPGPLKSDATREIVADGVACHVLGRVRDRIFGTSRNERTGEVTPGDADRRAAYLQSNPAYAARAIIDSGGQPIDRGEYRDGDRVGDSGVELSQENALRGLRGMLSRRVDTDEQVTLPPEPGRDVHLTIDAMLQARVQAIMSPELGLATVQEWHGQHSETQPLGTPLFGAALVLDIDTAEVLAMVSTPTFTRRQLREQPDLLFDTRAHPELLVSTPTLNRCIDKSYQPGSIVKAMLLSEAITRGNYTMGRGIECTGHLLPNQPNMYRCWYYKRFKRTHNDQLGHNLDGDEAVMCSCNIFFFTLGQRLGIGGIRDSFRAFGVGEDFELGIGHEFAGRLGQDRAGKGLTLGDAIQMGIGQGPVSWTPLHAADAYATLARDGVRVRPRILANAPRGEPVDLKLDPAGLEMAKRGLWMSVNDDRGTGHHLSIGESAKREPIFNAPGIKVWGKTGTATASPIVDRAPDRTPGIDEQDGEDHEPPRKGRILEEGDHSWFVVMAGRDRPKYVIAVVVDFGGSGGKVSGPICNQIVHALIAEGFL